ncbi:DUF4946 domain-containing protein [Pseudomonas sp. HR96]|uniref:DUF4946 domain-containing protein n=1 Tax=Pseudomonas sp. HR96 TaxID=1027966 RepID=UPI002A76603E|nr:DUF4946 domain-containing protein [Pseudomonas sp. HR96]WPP01864.1 DUF4946 domain-containing protein [Pseudomonas sp. HR96]
MSQFKPLLGAALLAALGCTAPAGAADLLITWPADWQVQPLPPGPEDNQASRQRAVKNDANGDPLMVVELTRTNLQPGHQVNLQAVLLEMRKSVQIHFSHGGYQSLCTRIHDSMLGDIPALETTCKIQLNGGHVMTQTLVAAAQQSAAYSLSYAGSAAGYDATEEQVRGIRASLKLLQ